MWEFRDEILLRGRECNKTRENFIFSEKGQNGNFTEIVKAKNWKFSRSRMMKRTSPIKSSLEIKLLCRISR